MNCCWCTITTADMEASLRFYTELVGLSVESRFSPNAGVEIVFLKGENDFKIELIRRPDAEKMPPKEGISLGFEAAPLQKALTAAAEAGIPVLGEPTELPNIRFFFVRDPNGVTVQFFEHKSPAGK